ncbi:MAG: PaaI family thioesterase [Candidatus Nanopelagicales bacterium]
MDLPLDSFAQAVPFAATTGVRMLSASPEEVVAVLDLGPATGNGAGVMHGGALMTLADCAASLCAFLNLPEGAVTSTTDSFTRFLRPVSAGAATATARPLRVGRSAITVETEIRDDDGRLVAKTSQSQAVITPV